MKENIIKIKNIINLAEKFRSSYFWAPPATANARRAYEVRNSEKEITWQEGGHTYTAEYIVECSCRNIYARGIYTKDGRKTNITAIKNSLKRLEKMV